MRSFRERTGCWILLVVLVASWSVQGDELATVGGNRMLLYKINNDKSIYVLDKMNKQSFLSDYEYAAGGRRSEHTPRISDTFRSEESNAERDYQEYTLLDSNENFMLVGAINKLYNISLADLNDQTVSNRMLDLNLDHVNTNMGRDPAKCNPQLNKYYNQYDCLNYVKVGIPFYEQSKLLTCSTNGNQPFCQDRSLFDEDATLNTTTINIEHSYMPSLVQITKSAKQSKTQNIPAYAYQGSIYFFHSNLQTQNIFKQNYEFNQARNGEMAFTELVKTPLGAIKNPNFRTSYGYDDKVYFFFSELEITDVLFKSTTSYIGEVCANDNGRNSFSDPTKSFLTFKKSIINCYIPDFESFMDIKYNEIQAVTKPIRVTTNSNETYDVFYGIFTLRRANSIDSALCMYKMSSVQETMRGLFKNKQDDKPKKPYATCDKYKSLDSIEKDNYYKEIIKNNKFQMEQTLNSMATFALNNVKFTSVTVDAPSSSSTLDHVIYVGLDTGRVLKLISRPHPDGQSMQTIIVSDYELFPPGTAINNLLVHVNPATDETHLIAMSTKNIKSLAVSHLCDRLTSCTQCVQSFCRWSSSRCEYVKPGQLLTGEADECPIDVETTIESSLIYTINDQTSMSLIRHVETKPGSSSVALTALCFVFVLILSGLVSMMLTCLFIKRFYRVAYKNKYHTTDVGPRWFPNSLNDRLIKFLNKHHFNESSHLEPSLVDYAAKIDPRQKVRNCYEVTKSSLMATTCSPGGGGSTSNNALKPVSVVCSRPNSASDSPYTNTTTSSTIESSHNSPNNQTANAIKYANINDTLSSSSDDCCCYTESDTTATLTTKKYSLTVHANKYANTDDSHVNVTSSLLINKSST